MKSQLALRPIHLSRTERVKAHVSICIWAHLLINTMEMIFKQSGCSTSPEEALKQIQNCRLNQVGFKDSSNYSITMTLFEDHHQAWIKLLQCQNYLKPKSIKQIRKSFVGTKIFFSYIPNPYYAWYWENMSPNLDTKIIYFPQTSGLIPVLLMARKDDCI